MRTAYVRMPKSSRESRKERVMALTRAIEGEARSLGITIGELCDEFGITRNSWRFWREGQRVPHQLTVDGLRSHAGRLHVLVEWLNSQLEDESR